MNTNKNKTNFSEFMSYLIPSVLSMLSVAIYSFIDTFVVGRAIGAQAVAAMGLGTPVLCFFFGTGLLFGTGGGVVYAVQKGMGNKDAGKEIFSTAVLSIICFGVLVAVFGNIFMRPLVHFLGATPGNEALTMEYLRWIISCCIITMLDPALNAFMRNEGHPGLAMASTTIGTGLNIVLDILFVMVFDWGMGSAAMATCMGSTVCVAITVVYCLVHKTNLSLKIKKYNIRRVPEMCKIGLGSFVNEIATAVILVVFLNRAGADFGDVGIAAYSIIQTLNMTAHSLLIGTSQAAQPIMSEAYGADDKKRIAVMTRYTLIFTALLGAVFMVLGIAFPALWCGFFGDDSPATIVMAAHGFRLHSAMFLISSVGLTFGTYFQATTKSLEAGLILVGRNIALPIIALFVLEAIPAIGSSGLWIAIPVAEVVGLILSVALKTNDSRRERKRVLN